MQEKLYTNILCETRNDMIDAEIEAAKACAKADVLRTRLNTLRDEHNVRIAEMLRTTMHADKRK